MSEIPGLPLPGYKPTQSCAAVDLVAEGKFLEERVLRYIERVEQFAYDQSGDARFVMIGRSQIQLGFMAVVRGVFAPSRVELPEEPHTPLAPV